MASWLLAETSGFPLVVGSHIGKKIDKRRENSMEKIKIGDAVNINGKNLYLAAMDRIMTYEGEPCVFLAENLENKNTYGRYSQKSLRKHGYVLEKTMKKIKDLWVQFGEIPMNPETECIEEEWHGFPAGTFREDIWHWFEEKFNVSVAEDLMGL